VTALRVLALASAALGLVAGASLLPGHRLATRGPPPGQQATPRPAAPRGDPSTAVSTAALTSPTLTPGKPAPDLHALTPSILSRAAEARALDRAAGATCRPLARPDDSSCAPQRDTVEIQWDVGKDP
jgi:hypothetical protein